MAHAQHAQVREAYESRCGYCGVHENDAGGEFTVDHFTPTSAGGEDGGDNLVYCCFRCHLFKADFHATKSDIEAARVLLHPKRDDEKQHIRVNESTGHFEPLSTTGQFHIALLRLNRPALVAYRRRRYQALLDERGELLAAQNRELRAIIAAQQKLIARLRLPLGDELNLD